VCKAWRTLVDAHGLLLLPAPCSCLRHLPGCGWLPRLTSSTSSARTSCLAPPVPPSETTATASCSASRAALGSCATRPRSGGPACRALRRSCPATRTASSSPSTRPSRRTTGCSSSRRHRPRRSRYAARW
jgi:hypothetical protein